MSKQMFYGLLIAASILLLANVQVLGQKDCDFVCAQVYKPVCGSDGKTYGNECQLDVAACSQPGLKKVSDKRCCG